MVSTKKAPIRTAVPTLRAIFEALQATGITQDELARRIHTSQTMISSYRTGKCVPSIATVEEICAAIGVELVVRVSSRDQDSVDHAPTLVI